jgi:hypothetical protein
MDLKILTLINSDQHIKLNSLKKHTQELLDHTPRFDYFTLHGTQHTNNLFKITNLLMECGLNLDNIEAFLLCCSICIHDIGMVIPLKDFEHSDIFGGKPQVYDPANLEVMIRKNHNSLVSAYTNNHFDFLASLGFTPHEISLITEISRNHRVTDLSSSSGIPKYIGALLRVIDELDISPSRAPIGVLRDHYSEMDVTSCWHWFKHNISADWIIGHNVILTESPKIIDLLVQCSPPGENSIPYWQRQLEKPIRRVLHEEGAREVIREHWGLTINVNSNHNLSSAISLGKDWAEIETISLSAGRKVILVIDDEVRKLEDLFLPLMHDYHIMFAPNAKDGIDKLRATKIDLAIVDLQVGSGYQWTAEETNDFKMTGLKICQTIEEEFPNTSFGILTGSRYDLSALKTLKSLSFIEKKPVNPMAFEEEIKNVLRN